MFQKNQSNWNLSINSVMYSCTTIRAGTNSKHMMGRIAKIVNGLASGYFRLRPCLRWFISSSCATPSKMERFEYVVDGFQRWAVLAEGSVLVVLLVLAAPLMLFIQGRYFVLVP